MIAKLHVCNFNHRRNAYKANVLLLLLSSSVKLFAVWCPVLAWPSYSLCSGHVSQKTRMHAASFLAL